MTVFEMLGIFYTGVIIGCGIWLGIIKWCERRREKYVFKSVVPESKTLLGLTEDEMRRMVENAPEATGVGLSKEVYDLKTESGLMAFMSLAEYVRSRAENQTGAVDELIRPVERGDKP